jgi:hypothetical protein
MDIIEVDLLAETNPAATTKWINRTTGPAPIRGHRLQRETNGSYWCACGYYCGGAGWDDRFRGVAYLFADARQRHSLHLVQLHNQDRRS